MFRVMPLTKLASHEPAVRGITTRGIPTVEAGIAAGFVERANCSPWSGDLHFSRGVDRLHAISCCKCSMSIVR